MSVQPLQLFTCDICHAEKAGATPPPGWEQNPQVDKTFVMCGECIANWRIFSRDQKARAALKSKPAPKGKR